MSKLHLGCGQKYFNGYINIDYPPSEHTVMEKTVADQFANLLELKYDSQSIEEVRLHHVFEHFPRATACALLASWNSWLKNDGILHIEVPDFKRTALQLFNPFNSAKNKFIALRHIFGSQEAHWAIHYDGYSKENLKTILTCFGFSVSHFKYNSWMGTYNIEVIATKKKSITKEEAISSATLYLKNFMISEVPSEQMQLKTWVNDFTKQLSLTFSA